MLKIRGFTLIEIMIALAIIAILAAVGYPNYTSYVQRGRIAEAISGLSDMRVKIEQYFQDNRTYVGGCGAGDGATPPLPTATANFTFSCPAASVTATAFTILATGTGSMSAFRYSINQTNTRTTLGLPAGWAGTANPCWVLKKDGSC